MSFLRELITVNLEDDQRRRDEEAAAEIRALRNEMTEREFELRSQGQHELNVVRGEAARRHEEIMANLARAAEMRIAEQSRAASRAASIACDDMAAAGELLQDLAGALGLTELRTVAAFPADYDAFLADPLSSWIESTFGVRRSDHEDRLVRAVPQTIDAALITRAQGVCDRAAGIPLAQEIPEVTGALAELAGALRFYHRIATGQLAPEVAYGMCASLPHEHAHADVGQAIPSAYNFSHRAVPAAR
jgi:hypothetical protein